MPILGLTGYCTKYSRRRVIIPEFSVAAGNNDKNKRDLVGCWQITNRHSFLTLFLSDVTLLWTVASIFQTVVMTGGKRGTFLVIIYLVFLIADC